MTPEQARKLVSTLPAEFRESALAGLVEAWEQGFLTGVAKLPRINPFAQKAPAAEPKRKR